MRRAVESRELRSTGWWHYVKTAPFLALVSLELDQLTKLSVRETLALGESVPGGGSLRLTHVVNPGVVFGIPASPTVSLVVPLAAIVACLVLYWRFERSNSLALNIGIGLFIGGSLGNLVDRIAYGHVTDFIEVVLSAEKVAIIFNLADLWVILGLVLLETFLIGVIVRTIRERGVMYNPMRPPAGRHTTGKDSKGK